MDAIQGFDYRKGVLQAGGIPLAQIADAVGTPTYVYSAEGIRQAYGRLQRAFAPLRVRTRYAVKACSNLHICKLLHELGAGMDVVSGGELERAWLAGASMSEITFSGVGKTAAEIRAALDGRHSPLLGQGAHFGRCGVTDRGPVGMFNVESLSELEQLVATADELGVRARACLRVNPNVDAHTHEHITTGRGEDKFGIEVAQVPELFEAFAGRAGLDLVGLHMHIGSQVREVAPHAQATQVLLQLMADLEAAGHTISCLNLGGGWAVDYQSGESPGLEAHVEALKPLLTARVERGLQLVIEPGRVLLANAGLLLTRIQHIKQTSERRFLICDAGMQTLIRPALYQAFHFIWPVVVAPDQVPAERTEQPQVSGLLPCDVVGPICESADFLARQRGLPPLQPGDLLAIFSAGAYGMSMASNYNDHGRPAEILVDGDRAILINQRQPLSALLETERQVRDLELG